MATASFRPAALPQLRHREHRKVVVALFPQPPTELAPEEQVFWEAAIQLGLVTINTAQEQVAHGRNVASWMARQNSREVGCRELPTTLDRLFVLALVTFNLLVLAALGTAIAWGFKFLI